MATVLVIVITALVCLIGVPGATRGQAPPVGEMLRLMQGGAGAQERPCPEERDQLRILARMLGQGRGSAELALADAHAHISRLEAELGRLKKQDGK